ncbi:circadian clock protein KaiC [Nannocystis bainbridge]|uniref:non-specific serine/threonine protein kinase n=1 Tax=Nannocystis bainbridge TaxID=2995303 RepID=A0ABT5E5Z5_9BACT|nr:circadian clock protein KaiC [Nannocystis bainbridge]MDC0721274.1 circadian clock protein KaiC [Nannocystis bainbridge]
MTAITASERASIPKAPTGINGLDDITGGGLPRGRPTLVCGSAGCGKTLMAMEFLVRGAIEFDEPGVFFAFEETADDLTANVRSLGFDLDDLAARDKLIVEHIHIERSEIEEAGEFDLEGLFIRLGLAIDTVGAKRVVLDTLETLFGGFDNEGILRAELRRLFRWLKDRGVTAVITAERGDGTLTRQGLEEYVSDCVIQLDHRMHDQVSTRRLRIVKYRGTHHGTNEYPFLIDSDGFSVLPLSSLKLDHEASTERVSTGIERLDAMLAGGVYRGTSVLLSGTAGTGKSSIAAHMAAACCARGERCLYYSFEESPSQVLRNMRTIGLDLAPWLDNGMLHFVSTRPTFHGLEMHLATMFKHVREFDPQLVVIDPISNFISVGTAGEAQSMLLRLVDYLKSRQTTAVFVSLISGGKGLLEATEQNISSLIDTWILLRDVELGGERNRGLHVLKSRGTPHSNQVREFVLTAHGVELRDVYVGPEGVLTGSMRLVQEAKEREASELRRQAIARKRREIERKRQALTAQIAALRAESESEELELELLLSAEEAVDRRLADDRVGMASSRRADGNKQQEESP